MRKTAHTPHLVRAGKLAKACFEIRQAEKECRCDCGLACGVNALAATCEACCLPGKEAAARVRPRRIAGLPSLVRGLAAHLQPQTLTQTLMLSPPSLLLPLVLALAATRRRMLRRHRQRSQSLRRSVAAALPSRERQSWCRSSVFARIPTRNSTATTEGILAIAP